MAPDPALTDEQLNAIPGSAVFVVKQMWGPKQGFVVKQLNTVGLHMPLGARLHRRAIVCGARLGYVAKPKFTDTQLQSVREYPSPPSTTRRSSLQQTLQDVGGPR